LFLDPKTPRLNNDVEFAADPQLEQNVHIPDIELMINPKIQAILNRASSVGKKAVVAVRTWAMT
jgi:hypothetical protein